MRRNIGWLLWGAVLSGGCADLSKTVPRSLLAGLSVENKLALFEAENELAIAWDEHEQAVHKILEVKAAMSEAQEQVSISREDKARAEQKKNAKGAQVSASAIKSYSAKVDYLDAVLDAARVRLRVKEAVVVVAEAQFELVKARLIKKNSVDGAQNIKLPDFEQQVERCVKRVRQRQQELAAVEKHVAEVKKPYLAQRDQLDKMSGGGLGSPWAEDPTPWLE